MLSFFYSGELMLSSDPMYLRANDMLSHYLLFIYLRGQGYAFSLFIIYLFERTMTCSLMIPTVSIWQ